MISFEAIITAMPLVNPIVTDRGMNRTAVPKSGEAHHDEHDAGHGGAHQQSGNAELDDDAANKHHEGPGRPRDLAARAAERRDNEAGDDRRVDAGFRLDAGRNGEGHREGQGDEADGDAGNQIRETGSAACKPGRISHSLGTSRCPVFESMKSRGQCRRFQNTLQFLLQDTIGREKMPQPRGDIGV